MKEPFCDFIQNLSQAPSKCLSKWIKGIISKTAHRIFYLFYISISVCFLSSASSFGHSDPDPSSAFSFSIKSGRDGCKARFSGFFNKNALIFMNLHFDKLESRVLLILTIKRLSKIRIILCEFLIFLFAL